MTQVSAKVCSAGLHSGAVVEKLRRGEKLGRINPMRLVTSWLGERAEKLD